MSGHIALHGVHGPCRIFARGKGIEPVYIFCKTGRAAHQGLCNIPVRMAATSGSVRHRKVCDGTSRATCNARDPPQSDTHTFATSFSIADPRHVTLCARYMDKGHVTPCASKTQDLQDTHVFISHMVVSVYRACKTQDTGHMTQDTGLARHRDVGYIGYCAAIY
jgi:hypothetical protein